MHPLTLAETETPAESQTPSEQRVCNEALGANSKVLS